MAISSAGNKREEHQYECLNCKFKWPNFAGPQSCPMCEHNYVKWLSYKEDEDGNGVRSKSSSDQGNPSSS